MVSEHAVTLVVSGLNWNTGKVTLYGQLSSLKFPRWKKMHIVVIFDTVLFFFL